MKINLLKYTSINSVHCVSPEIGCAHRKLRNISKYVFGKPILCVLSIFSNRMHGTMVDGKPIQLMEIPYSESCLFLVSDCMAEIVDEKAINFWKFQNDVVNSAYGVPPVARCSTWCTVFYLVHGVLFGARCFTECTVIHLVHDQPTTHLDC